MQIPYSTVSVWTLMELIPIQDLISTMRSVLTYASMLGKLPTGDKEDTVAKMVRDNLKREYEKLRTHCEKLKLLVSTDQITTQTNLLGFASIDLITKSAEQSANMICTTIQTELRHRLFFVLPSDNVKFYSERALFGEKVENAFPSASPEIAEAAKCYALGRNSACVFHLMRALEVGINCIATPFGVNAQHTNWHNVLEQIDAKVRAISSQSHGPNWKDEQQFYSEAVAHFHVLKNAWRNYAMHLHERYDPERAMDIWNSVRAFMRHLATRLSETP
jgi:hypothetical protein